MNRMFISKMSMFIISLTAILIMITSNRAYTGSNMRETLFRDADQALKTARGSQADLYAPKSFEKGMDSYNSADKDFNKGKIRSIADRLVESVEYFNDSTKKAENAMKFFSEIVTVRKDALNANAIKFDIDTWDKAEHKFRSAAIRLEDGKKESAKSYGEDAEKLYRLAELNGIKTKYLKPVWDLLEKIGDMRSRKYVSDTIKNATALANTAEMLIDRDRYDFDEASKMAEHARYEASHAIYLAKAIEKMHDTDKTFENVMLSVEVPLQKIADEFGMSLQFDEGLDIPTQNILEAIKKIQEENRKYASAVSGKESEIKNIKKRLGKLNSLKARQDKISRISASLSKKEGKALMEGDNVIIRLYGLNFGMGKSIIKPKYYNLLTKVKNIIAEFPGCKVIIEGHTDSTGSYDINKLLSRERAEAVKQYLRANSTFSLDRMMAIGYGASKPIATNRTKSGRAMNRRIDIVIQPAQDW